MQGVGDKITAMTDLKKRIRNTVTNDRSVLGKIQCLLERTEGDKVAAYEVTSLLRYTYAQFRAVYMTQHHNALEEQVEDAFVAHMEKSY